MRTFGTYELIASLAAGGMSTVWLARSPGADGIVVLKRLLREHLGETDVVAMFHDEAALGELLRHPNLVRQYEHGVAEGEPYIVLERLEGEDVRSLRRAIRKRGGTVPLDVALEIVVGACRGLHAAHELRGPDGRALGVVHRDVSPHNVIVTFDGNVKVLDFGIAKSSLRRTKTRAGVLKGKIPYMAPEQIRSEPVDRRTDVYALGVMLYELTVGERPYFMPQPSEFALMMAIVRGDVRWPSAARPDYPPALEAIVMRALSGTLEKRQATAAELEAEIAAFRSKEGLREGREVVRAWVEASFADRIEALRAAASPEELAARLVDAEQRRRAAADDGDDDADTAQRAPASAARAAGAQYALSRRPLGAAVLATLSGRINESFDGGAAGRTLAESKLVVMDLSGVERVTSYGVREWLAMLAECKGTELWLARCSEPVVAQLSTVKGFTGHGRVASVLLSFRCDTCGTATTLPFDLELDAAELGAGALASRACTQCGSESRPDDDPATLHFTKRRLGRPLPPPVRSALLVLERESESMSPPVEKVVLGTETHVRIRRALDRRARFRRLLDGIEGHLRVDVRDPSALDDRAAAELGRALLDLGPEVGSIAVHGATRALTDALLGPSRGPGGGPGSSDNGQSTTRAGGRPGSERVEIASWFGAARCPRCDASRMALVTPGSPAVCGKCNGRLELLMDDDAPPVSLGRRRPTAASTAARARGDVDTDPARRGDSRARDDTAGPANDATAGDSSRRDAAAGDPGRRGATASDSGKRDAATGDSRGASGRAGRDTAPSAGLARDEGASGGAPAGSERSRPTPEALVAPSAGTGRRSSGGRLAAVIGSAAVLAAAVAWILWGRPPGAAGGGAAPGPTQSVSAAGAATGTGAAAAPRPEPAPPPEERVEQRGGAREITAIGRGPTDDDALAAARARALVLLVDAVRAALPAEARDVNDHAAAAASPDDVGHRFLEQMGAGATPERVDTRPLAAPGERALAVRFRVSDAVFDQAVARWGTVARFRGLRVVPALPTVAGAGWLVVTAPASAGAPHPADRIVAIGSATLAPADLPGAAIAAAPEIQVVRGGAPLRLRWPSQEPTP